MCISEMAIMSYVADWAVEVSAKPDKEKQKKADKPQEPPAPPVSVPPSIPRSSPSRSDERDLGSPPALGQSAKEVEHRLESRNSIRRQSC